MSRTEEDGTEVVEFSLAAETYCVDIDYVTEVVERADLTEVPNTPSSVAGVMDLRGRTTTIVDPKDVFDIDSGDEECHRIVVFDADRLGEDSAVGWLVDDVHRVVRASRDDLERTAVADERGVEGVLKTEEDFVIWIDPEAAAA